MGTIKLFKIETLEDGTERFQTQLQIGKNVASFVREPNGKMKVYGNRKGSFNFYEYNEPYEIVNNIKDMRTQQL